MTEQLSLKRNPYGIAEFSSVRAENYAYVDKTRFIELLERADTKTPFFVRPRRFGKTLFTQTLQAYYDKAAAEDFDRNFAGTYIASHKTPLANSFYVLSLDCSGIMIDDLKAGLARKVRLAILDFSLRYQFDAGIAFAKTTTGDSISIFTEFLIDFLSTFKGKLYLIIDEYDQVANDVLANDIDAFRALTASGGILKTFYNFLKECFTKGYIARIFLTGVTSISLDSMTSGFTITDNITSDPVFSSAAGFTEVELRQLIPQIITPANFKLTTDDLVNRMRDWYNGYRFSSFSDETVFNSSMCLYYLSFWKRYGREPDTLLDPAVASDLSKIRAILNLGLPADVNDILQKATAKAPLDFITTPSALDLQNINHLNRQNLLTALVYFGYLTYAPGNKHQLVIPNRAMAQQFFDVYFNRRHGQASWSSTQHTDFSPAINALSKGNPRPFAESVAQWLVTAFGAQKDLNLHESDFQTAMLMVANSTTDYDYMGDPEVWGVDTHRYPDVLLTSRHGGPSYLFELKHVSKTQAKEHPDSITTALGKAKEQLAVYVHGTNIRDIPNLKAFAVIYVGRRLEMLEPLSI